MQAVVVAFQHGEVQVIAQRAREQAHVLSQIADQPAQVARLDLAQLCAVHQNAPFGRGIKPAEHLQQCRFARSIGPQHGDMLPRLDQHGFDVHRRCAVILVAEDHVAQFELAFQLFPAQIGARLCGVLRRGDNRVEPVKRAFDIAPPRHRARQLRQRPQRPARQDTDRDDRPHGKFPRKHQIGAHDHRCDIGGLLNPLAPEREEGRELALL